MSKQSTKADQLRAFREAKADEATRVKRKKAPNGTFEKRAYQRELMRKRRAKGGTTPIVKQ